MAAVLERSSGLPVSNAVARHEAAHAVVWRHLGAPVDRIVLHSNGATTYVNVGAIERGYALAWATLVGKLAGHVLDLREGRHSPGSVQDLADAMAPAFALLSYALPVPGLRANDLTLDGIIRAARNEAERILTERASDVDAVAELVVAITKTVIPGSSIEAVLISGGSPDL